MAQTGLSGQQDREAQVEGFKNRLEALASPAVVQCFMSGDIGNEPCRMLFLIMYAISSRLLFIIYRSMQKICANIFEYGSLFTIDPVLSDGAKTLLLTTLDGNGGHCLKFKHNTVST